MKSQIKKTTKSKSVKSDIKKSLKPKSSRHKTKTDKMKKLRDDARKKANKKALTTSVKQAITKDVGETSLRKLINNPGNKPQKIVIPESEIYYRVTGGKPSVKLTQLNEGMCGYSINSVRASVPKDQLVKEYSRLRSVIQKRVKSFESANIGSTEIKNISKSLQRVQDLSNNPTTRERQIIKRLVEYNRFLSHETSSVRGYKQDANEWIERMRDKGYDVNQYNYDSVIDALEYLSTAYKGLIYDSDQIIEVAIDTVNEKMRTEGQRFFNRYTSSSYRNKLRKEVIEQYESSNITREQFARELRSRDNKLF